MYIKQHPRVYANPQPAPSVPKEDLLLGFDDVMIALRKIKFIDGFVIISEQELIFNTRVISWRVGSIYHDSSMVFRYNFTLEREWFTIQDSPINIEYELEENSLYDIGENHIGPNGNFTFDERTVVAILEDYVTNIIWKR